MDNTPWQIGSAKLEMVQGDITKQRVDAIVNAANAALAGGGGVDGAIHRAGGPSIMDETDRLYPNGCPTGSAVITGAGNLPVRHVIHAVGPRYRDGRHHEPELLASAYRTCLQLADQHNLTSIAFPSISTGVYSYPIETAAHIALTAIRDHLLQPATTLQLVRMVLFDDITLHQFERAARDIISLR